jgi:hypothetical protein
MGRQQRDFLLIRATIAERYTGVQLSQRLGIPFSIILPHCVWRWEVLRDVQR